MNLQKVAVVLLDEVTRFMQKMWKRQFTGNQGVQFGLNLLWTKKTNIFGGM